MIRFSFFLAMLVLVCGCARVGVGYLTEQGYQQMRLQWRGVDNEKLLKDPNFTEDWKRKILLVGEYKKFFYHYFGAKSTDIYSKTVILENKAVTYLVIATPHTKIEPYEFKFPFVGHFPYIGFFSKDSAKDFAKDLEEDENLVTWIRPVYAYSTLGYLEDRILSSFFHYDDVELAELVFHELFHTIFFIKDEVELNENLANLYGRELLAEYFKDRPELKEYLATEEKIAKRNERIVELIDLLKGEFAKLGVFLTGPKADELTVRFVREVLVPEIRGFCQKVGLSEEDCQVKDDWNQASFAAFLTYEEEQDFLTDLKAKKGMNLKAFLEWLRAQYDDYKKDKKKFESFTDHLKAEGDHAPAPTH